MTDVQLPDGSIARFPDAMAPADIAAVLQKQFPPTGGAGGAAIQPTGQSAPTATVGGVNSLTGAVGKMDPAKGGVSENVQPLDREGAYRFQLDRVRRRHYPNLTDEQWARVVASDTFKPYDAGQLFNNGLTVGLGDEARGAADALTALLSGKDAGQAYNDFSELERRRRDLGAERSGLVGTAAEFGGAVLAGRPDQAATIVASKLPAWVKGGMDAAKQGAVFGFASTEGDLKDRASGALTGAAFGGAAGAAVPTVAGKVGDMITSGAQRRATNAAIKGAPDAADLKSAASALFETGRAAKAAVKPDVFVKFASDLVEKAKGAEIDAMLDGDAVAAYRKMVTMAQEALDSGGISLARLHNLRQIANDVVADATKDRTKRFGKAIVDGLDELIGGLKPDQIAGQGGTEAANALLEGISTWSRAKKLGVIEEAIYQARNQASGFENGLRIQFRRLLKPDMRKQFTQAEIQAIEQIANGTSLANLTRLIGKFGFGSGGASNALGGFLGGTGGFALGGPLGAAAVALGATGAKKVSEKLTEAGANRVAKVVATPNIPNVKPADMIGLERALQSLIRGGQPLISQ